MFFTFSLTSCTTFKLPEFCSKVGSLEKVLERHFWISMGRGGNCAKIQMCILSKYFNQNMGSYWTLSRKSIAIPNGWMTTFTTLTGNGALHGLGAQSLWACTQHNGLNQFMQSLRTCCATIRHWLMWLLNWKNGFAPKVCKRKQAFTWHVLNLGPGRSERTGW